MVPKSHEFSATGNVETGKVWGTTTTEVKCSACGLTYWVGRDKKSDTECEGRNDEKN